VQKWVVKVAMPAADGLHLSELETQHAREDDAWRAAEQFVRAGGYFRPIFVRVQPANAPSLMPPAHGVN
jgi:hypothetical protein